MGRCDPDACEGADGCSVDDSSGRGDGTGRDGATGGTVAVGVGALVLGWRRGVSAPRDAVWCPDCGGAALRMTLVA